MRRERSSCATGSKRCGWRGTMIVSVLAGSARAAGPASASKISDSSPSRVDPATHTGRPSPARARNSRPSERAASGMTKSNFKLPIVATSRAPRSVNRCASADVCAATPANDCSMGRDSDAMRAYPAAERADKRALTRNSGIPRRRHSAARFGHISVSINTPARGAKRSRNARTANGTS